MDAGVLGPAPGRAQPGIAVQSPSGAAMTTTASHPSGGNSDQFDGLPLTRFVIERKATTPAHWKGPDLAQTTSAPGGHIWRPRRSGAPTLTRSTRRPPVTRTEIAAAVLFFVVLSWLALMAISM